MALATGIIALAANALEAYTLTAQARARSLDWQMGADKQKLVQLEAENAHLRTRLAVYEAQNAKPGSGGSSSGQL